MYNNIDVLKNAKIENFLFEHNIIVNKVESLTVSKETKKIIYNDYIVRRSNREPLQYIIGEWDFYNLNFFVGKGVLIPRQDTEILIDTVLSLNLSSPIIYDLCSGSGCIGITLNKNIPFSKVTLIEKEKDAFYYMIQNKHKNKSDSTLILDDIFLFYKKIDNNSIDIIVSNPPYISTQELFEFQKEIFYEPKSALFSGKDSLYFYKNIACLYKSKLKNNGFLVFEIGYNQGESVKKILNKNGYKDIKLIKDYNNNDRVVFCKK